MSAASSPSPEPEELVLYEVVEPHIARITLNRPHRRNAILTPDMNVQMKQQFERAEDDDDVKVIILAGAGDFWCAGEDITRTPVESFGLKKGERLPQSRRIRGVSRPKLDILRCDKVVIAAVQGGAIGNGFRLALACDLIVAAENAQFSRVNSRIGFASYDGILPVLLLKLGINRGYELLLTGRRVSAEELHDWGVVCSVVSAESLRDEALRYARAVAAHSTDGLMIGRVAKDMFWDMLGLSAYEAFNHVAHPLFTNLVWREDEANMLRERSQTGSSRDALKRVYERWEELGFE